MATPYALAASRTGCSTSAPFWQSAAAFWQSVRAKPLAVADCQKGAEVLQPVLDAAKAYGVAIDADEAAGAARAVAELAPLTAAAADDDDEV